MPRASIKLCAAVLKARRARLNDAAAAAEKAVMKTMRLQNEQRFEMAEAETTIFGRQVDPQETHFAVLAAHGIGQGHRLFFHVSREIHQLGTRKFARHILEVPLVFC